ncbi:MAG: hypothetical protein L3J11_01000 [Draconibacterium sp.]|nr:hypothetical protein [Draconibacterium sp.]
MNKLKYIFIVCVTLLIFTSACNSYNKNIQDETPATFQLNINAPIDKWDEAIPLGNGLTGGLLWGNGNEIHLSPDRDDLWDLRSHPGFTTPGFSHETVR